MAFNWTYTKLYVLLIEDKTWQSEGVTNNFLNLWAPKAAFFFCRWQQLNPRTPKEQITTTHHSETTPEQHSGGHTPMENMHADTVHTPAALFLDQTERLDGRWPPPNCEKQFDGGTSLWILIIERFTWAIRLIHRKDWWAAGSVSLPIPHNLISPTSVLSTHINAG